MSVTMKDIFHLKAVADGELPVLAGRLKEVGNEFGAMALDSTHENLTRSI